MTGPDQDQDQVTTAGEPYPSPAETFPGSDEERPQEMGAVPTEAEAEEEPAGLGEESVAEAVSETEERVEEVEDDIERTRREVAELTEHLKRLQAEFLNYKRRVERDRDLVRQNATYAVLASIIEVLDTIGRASEHAPLEGGFKAVAEQLERIVSGLGLTKFGTVGEPFDPTLHEALSHIGEDPSVDVTTCKVIAKAGYRIDDRVVRAAQVLVVDPVTEDASKQLQPEPERAASGQDGSEEREPVATEEQWE